MFREKQLSSCETNICTEVIDSNTKANLEAVKDKLSRLDNDWQDLCVRVRRLLLNHVLLVLMKKASSGALPRDQILKIMKMVTMESVGHDLIVRKLEKILARGDNSLKTHATLDETTVLEEILASAKAICSY